MSIEDPNPGQRKLLEASHSTREHTSPKTTNREIEGNISGANSPSHPMETGQTKATSPRILGIVEIIGGTMLVSVLLWIGVVLLWYTSGGLITFLGLLVTSIISLFGVIGVLWSIFLKNIWKFLTDRHWEKRQLFYKSLIISNVVAFLLCGGTLLWGFDPYTHLGWPTLSSSLRDSSDNYWHDQLDVNTVGTCHFDRDGTYHVTATQSSKFHYCVATATDFSDFIYEVQMRFINDGDDCGGIVFRADRAGNNLYVFEICQDQTYCLFRYITPSSPQLPHNLIGCNGESGNLPKILRGIDPRSTWITLAIEAKGEKFVLRVNGQIVDIGFDLSPQELKEGEIGVVADSLHHSTEVAFRNAKVWVFNGG